MGAHLHRLDPEALHAVAMDAARRRIAEVSMPRGAPVMILLHEAGEELDLWAGTLVRSWSDPEARGAELLGPVARMPSFLITPAELHRGYHQDQDGEPYLVLSVDGWSYEIVPMEPDA